MDQDSGLWKRGLLLFVFVAAIAGAALYVALSRPTPPAPERRPVRAEGLATLAFIPAAAFPASVNWAALGELNDSMPSSPGWEVRYNATLTLARKGSPGLPLDVLTEMLDEQKQMLNFREKLPDGQDVPDEGAARRTVLGALEGLTEWQSRLRSEKKFDPENADLQPVHEALNQLAQSSNQVLRAEAEKVRQALKAR